MFSKSPKITMTLLLMILLLFTGCPAADNSEPTAQEPPSAVTQQPVTVAEDTPATDSPASVDDNLKTMVKLLAQPVLPEATDRFDWEAKDKLREDNPVDTEFMTALNTFAVRTSTAVLHENGVNRNFSPLSLYYALALAASGAEGQTQKELLDLLGAADTVKLAEQSGNLYRLLFTDNEVTKLQIANSLWIDNDLEVTGAYTQNAVKHFYAWVFAADFTDPATAMAAARWVAANAKGTIEPQITLDANTVMLILNTVYFYDEWQKGFEKAQTAESEFELAGDDKVTCDFMQAEYGMKKYYQDAGFMRTELELKGGGVMSFILPDKDVKVDSLLADAARLQTALTGGEEKAAKMFFKMPKFKYGYESKLVEILKTLGISDAFDDQADFSGIDGKRDLYISDVIQQTHIGVDENGVEAAAFTQVSIATMSMPITLEETVEFFLERPFIYTITSREGALLFVGVCDNPRLD